MVGIVATTSHQTEPQWGGESKSYIHRLFCAEARLRRGLPYDLDREMEDVRRKGEEVQEVSIGLDADWFLRTNARHGTFSSHARAGTPTSIPSAVFWLKQETAMPQRAKPSTVVRT